MRSELFTIFTGTTITWSNSECESTLSQSFYYSCVCFFSLFNFAEFKENKKALKRMKEPLEFTQSFLFVIFFSPPKFWLCLSVNAMQQIALFSKFNSSQEDIEMACYFGLIFFWPSIENKGDKFVVLTNLLSYFCRDSVARRFYLEMVDVENECDVLVFV